MSNSISSLKLSKGWLIILLDVAALAVVGILVWTLAGSLESLGETRAELSALEKQAADSAANEKLLATLGDGGASIDGYFINRQTLPDLIEELESLAATAGVKFELTRADAPVENKEAKLNLELAVTGSFNQVLNFVSLVETIPHQVAFNNLRLNKDVSEKSPGWQAQISLVLDNYRDEKK